MMKKELLAMLNSGVSADTIAQDFADALNEANAEYKAQQEAEVMEELKTDLLVEMVATFCEYVHTFHPDSALADVLDELEFDTDKVIPMVDEAIEELSEQLEQLDELKALFNALTEECCPSCECDSYDCDCDYEDEDEDECDDDCECHDDDEEVLDALHSFLKSLGLA